MARLIGLLLIFFVSCSPKMMPDQQWDGKQWVLVELKGVPVQTSGTDKDAHLIFDASSKTLFGSGGCNRISGAYRMAKKGSLDLANVASTKMACEDFAFEESFLETLKGVNSFSTDDGFLYLKKNREVLMKLKGRGN